MPGLSIHEILSAVSSKQRKVADRKLLVDAITQLGVAPEASSAQDESSVRASPDVVIASLTEGLNLLTGYYDKFNVQYSTLTSLKNSVVAFYSSTDENEKLHIKNQALHLQNQAYISEEKSYIQVITDTAGDTKKYPIAAMPLKESFEVTLSETSFDLAAWQVLIQDAIDSLGKGRATIFGYMEDVKVLLISSQPSSSGTGTGQMQPSSKSTDTSQTDMIRRLSKSLADISRTIELLEALINLK